MIDGNNWRKKIKRNIKNEQKKEWKSNHKES